MSTGRLLVVEGADDVGKTTLWSELLRRLGEMGVRARGLGFPGRDPHTLGAHVYTLHHDPARFGVDGIDPLPLQMLHVAAHVDAIQRSIRPALARGETVVLDRYWWSTWVYGLTAGIPDPLLRAVLEPERVVWTQGITPGPPSPPDSPHAGVHATVFLVERDVSLVRPADRSLFERLTGNYRALAAEQRATGPDVVHRVTNDGTPSEVSAKMLDLLPCHFLVA